MPSRERAANEKSRPTESVQTGAESGSEPDVGGTEHCANHVFVVAHPLRLS